MLPGFGYRFLRQQRQYSNPSIERGATVVGRATPVVCVGVIKTPRRKFRPLATDRSENCAPQRVVRTGPDAKMPKMPRINLGRAHRKASEVVTASRFLTVFLGRDQGKQTFA